MPIPSGRTFVLLGLISGLMVFALVSPALGWTALGLDGLVLGLCLIDGWRSRATKLDLERELPRVLHQGERTSAGLRLLAPDRRSSIGGHRIRIHGREWLSPLLMNEPLEFRLELEPGKPASVTYPLVPVWRGQARISPCFLRVLGPWGLAWSERRAAGGEIRKVLPKAHLEGRAGILLRRAIDRRLGTNPLFARGISTELYALREYLPGDDYRRIHWKESARLNRPVTRENTWEQHQHLLILVDCGRPMASLSGHYGKLDHALSAVLALMRVVVAQQDSASLVLFSDQLRRVVRVDRRTRNFAAVFEQVYQEQADLEEPDYAAVAAWCTRRVPRRSLAIVCTSILDLVGAETLGSALGTLARRHRPLLVNLEDPGLIEHAETIPRDVLGAYAKTSALRLAAENLALGARLKARGIDVLNTPASRLAIGVIQRYLEHKSLVRL